MLTRRALLANALKGSSLVALSSVIPGFVANTAKAAEKGKDTVLVLIELSGGNDGMNTVIPYADDTYPKARPTLKFTKDQVVKLDDYHGLHPAMRNLGNMWQNGQLAVVQGTGYPNPDRSHFESMDIWHSADPQRKKKHGWIGRAASPLQQGGDVPVVQIGQRRTPLILAGGSGGVASVVGNQPYKVSLAVTEPEEVKARRQLMGDLAKSSGKPAEGSMLDFVQRRQLETYSTLDKLSELLRNRNLQQNFFNSADGRRFYDQNTLVERTQLIARLISAGFGTRVYYVMIDGFDTHSQQAEMHKNLVGEVADAIFFMFQTLQNQGGQDKRVIAMTYSEFGRRVYENGSKGTDHGSGACLFVAGPGVKGGLVGKHPSLTELDQGDLRYHTDFRRVYATVLDKWLGVDSKSVLDAKYEPLDFIKAKS